MEIQQCKTAHAMRELKIWQLRQQLHVMLERNARLQAEIAKQEAEFAAAVFGAEVAR